MAYTPELSMQDAQTLRRIAWALGMPMTKAMPEIFAWLSRHLDSEKVCSKCRDKTKCEGTAEHPPCLFNH